MRISIENRRKQLAQCIWLRQRVEGHLQAGEPLIVLGDFNDGPGLDEYEKLFGRSGVEIVLGENGATGLFDPHARMALSRRLVATPDLERRAPVWTIWHPFDHPACYGNALLRDALLTASDHFPVTIDIDL